MSENALGVISSRECKKDGKKVWFHIRKFIKEYQEVLENYSLFSTDGTAETIASIPEAKNLTVNKIGPETRGVVNLAARVTKDEIERVLFFQDPEDLKVERPENYALLRSCNIHGKKLYFNHAAHLWADYEKTKQINIAPHEDTIDGTVFFIAHDEEKPRMARFVFHYYETLSRFSKLIATAGTKRYIDEYLKERIPSHHRKSIIKVAGATSRESHGPTGGDVIIADEIYSNGQITTDDAYPKFHTLFFIDHAHNHPHESDIQVLLNTCVDPTYSVNLILNSRMAEEWIERYRVHFDKKPSHS